MQISFQLNTNQVEGQFKVIPVISIPNPKSKIKSVHEEFLYEYRNLIVENEQMNIQNQIADIFEQDLLAKGVNVIFQNQNPNEISEQFHKCKFNIQELKGINVFLKSINALNEWSNGKYREAQEDIIFQNKYELEIIHIRYLQFLKRIPNTISIDSIKIDLTFLVLVQENVSQISDLLKLALNGRKIKSFSFSVYEPITPSTENIPKEDYDNYYGIEEQEAFEIIIQQLYSFQNSLVDLEEIEIVFSRWTKLKEVKSLYAFLELIAKNGNLKNIKVILGLNENGFQLEEYSTQFLTKIINYSKNLKGLFLHIGNSWVQEYVSHLQDYAKLISETMITNCPNLTQFSLDMTQRSSYDKNFSLLISLQLFLKQRYFEYLNLNFSGWHQISDQIEFRILTAEQLVKTLTAPLAVRNYFICICQANLYQYYDDLWHGLAKMSNEYFIKKFSLRMQKQNHRNQQAINQMKQHSILTEQAIYQIQQIFKTYGQYFRKEILSQLINTCLKQNISLVDQNIKSERFRYYSA
ncbi:hypothetical protein TTHERM_01013200 (macronuclear) [Tetrahymena thermophila SB210]|uniref:Uncharacterized protein n=1 Tax=Tetrahymena thermophila (strain SB210) TaxID=312017 RepID=Q22L33_TETTS|nr:hypothetical protein TTHERM_01013200 [Tetrahymena thermophila SB210]EAR85984.2 hypothetical protein TTHERM_01013200 [Tetrahymena thermophila SB210]|eukprot:XP_976579.2 hypothetical protein TTHERM_01013200 [Tetrahymena thermophila SB210]